jgi:protein TonB
MRRGGPLLAVIAVHVVIIYGLSLSMGYVDVPKFAKPIEAVFIPEAPESKPEPIPQVKPDIPQPEPVDEPVPQVAVDEPVAPPADMPASDNALAASVASAPSQDLKASTRVEPTYPAISRRMGEEGQVQLRILVDESGKPKDVQVLKTSGFPRLDEAATQAVRKWRFKAATDGSKNIMAWTQIALTFKLTT